LFFKPFSFYLFDRINRIFRILYFSLSGRTGHQFPSETFAKRPLLPPAIGGMPAPLGGINWAGKIEHFSKASFFKERAQLSLLNYNHLFG